jgi:hypothetical protein
MLITAIKYFEFIPKVDTPRVIADTLSDSLGPDDQIYTGDTHQILYFLLRKKSPTRFVHRSLLWDPDLRKVLKIDLRKEAGQILSERPRYVLLSQNPPENELLDSILAHYIPIQKFPNPDQLLEHKNR